MIFEEYIKNPMGTKSSVLTNLKLYKDMYESKWNNLMLKENGIINYKLYTSKTDYYIHFKIPSEVIEKFYYDVVIRFFLSKEKSKGVIRNLKDYDVQFWSNDPRFVFVFCKSFLDKGLLIRDLDSKMSKLAIKEKPTITNPNEDVWYVKSLYFSYLTMNHLDLFSKSQWDVKAMPYHKSTLLNTITHADDKIRDRQRLGSNLNKKNKKKNKQYENRNNKSNNNSPSIKNFGHFKKKNYNTIKSKSINNLKNTIK